MWAAILGFLSALPEIMKLIKYFEIKFGPDWSNKVQDIGDAYAKLYTAKTQEERDAAGALLAKSWNK